MLSSFFGIAKQNRQMPSEGEPSVHTSDAGNGISPAPVPPARNRPSPARPLSVSSAVSAGGELGENPSPPNNTSSTSPVPISTVGPPAEMLIMSGWINKVEVRLVLGVEVRRRYWCALAEGSSYLYWFKERTDLHCVGRLSLSGAAFTYDARVKGKFTILSSNVKHVFETGDNSIREEWIKALQETRKRSWNAHINIDKDIHSLTIETGTTPTSPPRIQEVLGDSTGASREEPVQQIVDRTQSIDDLLSELRPRPSTSTTDEEGDGERTLRADGEEVGTEQGEGDEVIIIDGDVRPTSSPVAVPPAPPPSTFYLSTDGSLNENSLEMPRVDIVSPEAMLQRLTTEGIEKPARRAIDRARLGLKELRAGKGCEQCKKLVEALDASDMRVGDQEDTIDGLNEKAESLKKALLTTTRQLETLTKFKEMSKDEEEEMMFVLDKEKELTHAKMEVNELHRKMQDLEDENKRLDATVSSLQQDIEAFRDSLRTKEELIMKLTEAREVEERSERRASDVYGDVHVPEAILVEEGSIAVMDDEAQKICDEQSVRDVQEMRDLLEGYRHQNTALNNEIVQLHSMVNAYEETERSLRRNAFNLQGCYYQMKGRYIMVLNHFKNPDKPSKITEPGVLKELIEEANRKPRSARKEGKATDTLGFYLNADSDEERKAADLFETAAGCQRKANQIAETAKLEQSEDYMRWLEKWDSFLVNSFNSITRINMSSSPELKSLVRSGVPIAYRERVWKRLVNLHVREKQAEMGNGYFECLLKLAKKKKDEGVYDPAVKQIDLDLARTLPTNKHFEDPDSERIDSLRRVLYAFRYYNTDVGYCQGLNRLAAIGLLHLSEEEAFWFLTAAVDFLQPNGYYTITLIGAVADQKVLRDLVNEKMPRLANHLKSLEVDISLFTLPWFLTCFVDALPHSVYLSIFDVFLYEGNKVLFRFALAVLKLGESLILQCKTIGTVHACLSRASDFVPDFKKLAQVAFHELNPFPQKAIESKRAMYLNQLREQGYK